MVKTSLLGALALFAVSAFPAAVAADAIGEAEYLKSCAVCHGADGKGNGELAPYLTVKPTDLTQMKAENGGDFPVNYAIWLIDRRQIIPMHGEAMPVWGNSFTAQENLSLENASPDTLELLVRGRILSLVYYLESIQE